MVTIISAVIIAIIAWMIFSTWFEKLGDMFVKMIKKIFGGM